MVALFLGRRYGVQTPNSLDDNSGTTKGGKEMNDDWTLEKIIGHLQETQDEIKCLQATINNKDVILEEYRKNAEQLQKKFDEAQEFYPLAMYTPEQVREMSDADLCEALSFSREPKPIETEIEPTKESFCESRYSQNGNWINYWILSEDFRKHIKYWQPIDWFSPENWTKLQEELHIDTLHFQCDKHWFALIPEKVYCCSDRLSRAILEAALLCGQEEK
jgi:hypothetical protein